MFLYLSFHRFTDLQIQDSTTLHGSDYVLPVPSSVTFAPGAASQDIEFSILTDDLIENTESFTITLSNVNGAILTSPSSATVHIVDETGKSDKIISNCNVIG